MNEPFFDDEIEPFVGLDPDTTPDVGEYSIELDPAAGETTLCGFAPVVRPEEDDLDDGIGLRVGWAHFPVNGIGIPVVDGDSRETPPVMPTLLVGGGGGQGDPLDDDPPPREDLATGDWDAWILMQYMEQGSRARCVFTVRDSGPPDATPDRRRDEIAYRLCSFAVERAAGGEHVITEVYDQPICDQITHTVEYHPFKLVKLNPTQFYVLGGHLQGPYGTHSPKTSDPFFVANSATFTVAAGSIPLVEITWTKQVISVQQFTLSHPTPSGAHQHDLKLTNYAIGAAWGTIRHQVVPAVGVDATAVYPAENTFWARVGTYVIENGQFQVTDQFLRGSIFMNGMEESELTDVTVPP